MVNEMGGKKQPSSWSSLKVKFLVYGFEVESNVLGGFDQVVIMVHHFPLK
jgi:hypothetical protein